MRTVYDPTFKADLSYDDDAGVLRQLVVREPEPRGDGVADEVAPADTAAGLIRRMADRLGLDAAQVDALDRPVDYQQPEPRDLELHRSEERRFFDSTTYGYQQTWLNVPIWGAGLTVTVKDDPQQAVSLTNDTSTQRPDTGLPPTDLIARWQALFGTSVSEVGMADESSGEGGEYPTAPFVRSLVVAPLMDETAESASLGAQGDNTRLIRGRFFIYRYRADDRTAADAVARRKAEIAAETSTEGESPGSAAQQETPLVLDLAPVPPEIRDGDWRMVAELTFALATPDHGALTWLALVDVPTEAVLYLRALASGVNGMIFPKDPISATGDMANMPNAANAALNPLRTSVTLRRLDPPSGGVQRLRGQRVQVIEQEAPAVAPPMVPAGQNFDFDVRTNDFAAVSAYAHSDNLFQVIEDLGFPIPTYFNATNFPIAVDHRGYANEINAHCVGNGMGGIGHCCYGLNDLSDVMRPIGRACDSRVHWHELCGHGILYEHVNSANFGFSHSAGDSLSLIYHDPDSRAPDPYRYAPWHPTLARRCDRPVNGWGWGGANDNHGYGSEEILATCLFRIYEAIGGSRANPDLARRRFCSEVMMYLILRTVSTFTPSTNPGTPLAFANAMMATDLLNWTTRNVFGGAYNKVVRWSFEKQGVWRRAGDPATVAGQPPATDVYLDDGQRRGEYGFVAQHWENVAVWNRRAADGQAGHQPPKAGQPNFAYVRMRNRGGSAAANVSVAGYQGRAHHGLSWPRDFTPLTTPSLPGGALAPDNAQEKVLGPFTWTPAPDGAGKVCLLMVASAHGDPSNVSHFVAGETIEDWRLVPNDNNLAQRAMTVET